jgi:hypothetical protein
MKKEVERMRICGIHDSMDTHIDVVSYDDNTTDIDIVGNKARMILGLCAHAVCDAESFIELREALSKIANGIDAQNNGEGKLMSGSFESVFERLKNTEDEEEKACGFKGFIKITDDQDQLLKLLSMIQALPDFKHKADILKLGSDKLRDYFHA